MMAINRNSHINWYINTWSVYKFAHPHYVVHKKDINVFLSIESRRSTYIPFIHRDEPLIIIDND